MITVDHSSPLFFTTPFYRVFPNCTAKVKGEKRVLVGQDLSEARDVSSLAVRRPIDRGYIVAWDMQKEIWARSLRKLFPKINPESSGIVLTEPYMNLPALREAALTILFKELGFASVVMLPPAVLALRYHLSIDTNTLPNNQQQPHRVPNIHKDAGAGLVVDAGFSFTHAVPIFDWHVIHSGVKRIDLGGKALTNYMKELVSYRSINMMDEAYLLEHIKDRLCFVSLDIHKDLASSKQRDSPHKREWLLPDGVTSTWGTLRDPGNAPRGAKDPILVVNNERFMVPEALFHPSDIGMDEAGLAEAISSAVQATHSHLHALLYSNVVIMGGTAQCPGFKERLERELRPCVPDDYEVCFCIFLWIYYLSESFFFCCIHHIVNVYGVGGVHPVVVAAAAAAKMNRIVVDPDISHP